MSAFLALALLTGAEDKKDKDVVIIEITKQKKYVKKGDDAQKDVEVTVGQSVRWVNKHDETHTATCKLKGKDDKPLFDTGDLDEGKSSKDVVFDQKTYEAAGGKDGKPVTLPYYCVYHASMKSNIILKPKKE